MSLTSPNTPVSQQDLQDFYHKLLPYMGGSFGLIATGMDSANLYSTTERVVGQWIDGKPLYQKTIAITSGMPSSGGRTEFNHNIENIDYIVSQRARIIYPDSMVGMECDSVYIDGPDSLSNTQIAMVAVNATKIILKNTKTLANTELYVTLQYTKTTDSAVESYGTDTTYSTDEHVVGSWVDGRPVYQRTITGVNTPSSNNSDVTIYTFDSTVDIITDIRGYLLDQSIASRKGSIPINIYYANDAYITVFTGDTNGDSTKRDLRCRVSGWTNSPLCLTVQYVKKVSS